MKIAVIVAVQTSFSNRNDNLTDVKTFVGDKFSVHNLVLIRWSACKLINCFTWTVLNKELGQALNYFMSFKSHLCFVTRYQVEQHLLEIWVRDKISEDVDLVLLHQ